MMMKQVYFYRQIAANIAILNSITKSLLNVQVSRRRKSPQNLPFKFFAVLRQILISVL